MKKRQNFTHVKYKAKMKQMSKQNKLIDTVNVLMVTRGKKVEGRDKIDREGEIYGDKWKLDIDCLVWCCPN